MRQNLFYDRRPLGLEWQSVESVEPIEISVSPDLQKAEVLSFQSYLVQGKGGEHVILQQTSVYRRSGDRWLLSPPSFDFWGEKVSTRGRFLELSVLKRDEPVGLRIASELEATIGAACAMLRDLECQPDTQLEVNMLADPTLLLEMESPESRWQGSRYLNLPTPTLVGLPIDEVGFSALYRGYAERVVSALIGDLVDWPCCHQAHFYQALLDVQLSQLGLKHWPVTDEDYRMMSEKSVDVDEFRRLWLQDNGLRGDLTGPQTRIVYGFVEFLTFGANGASATHMMRRLSSANTLDEWLAQMSVEGSDIDADWSRFVQEKTGAPETGD